MKIEKYVVVLITFTMMLSGIFYTQAKMGVKYISYDVDLNVSEETRLTAVNKMNTISEDLQDRTLKLSERVSSFDPLAITELPALFVGIIAYLLQIPNALAQTIELVFAAVNVEVPTWFSLGIMTIIAALFILKIAAIVFKRDEL